MGEGDDRRLALAGRSSSLSPCPTRRPAARVAMLCLRRRVGRATVRLHAASASAAIDGAVRRSIDRVKDISNFALSRLQPVATGLTVPRDRRGRMPCWDGDDADCIRRGTAMSHALLLVCRGEDHAVTAADRVSPRNCHLPSVKAPLPVLLGRERRCTCCGATRCAARRWLRLHLLLHAVEARANCSEPAAMAC